MKQVYEVLDRVKDHFEANGITNKVSFGNNFRFDLDKTTMLPLAHFNMIDATFEEHSIAFRLPILCLGAVNKSVQVDPEDDFFGADDMHDVLNTQFIVLAKFINSVRTGSLYEQGLHLVEEPVAEMFYNLGDNQLAGWGAEVRIRIKNDISGC